MALLHVNFFSEVLGMNSSMYVILPQGVKGPAGTESKAGDGRIKVMYLLHGLGDDQATWIRWTSIERYVHDLGIAVVMPTTSEYFYTDTTFGMNYWTFISQEIPKICGELFPQISDQREDILAAGLSMGGYGAWKLGLRAPDRFGAAASLSGALDIVDDYGQHIQQDPGDGALFRGIFGDAASLEGSDDDIMALAEKCAQEHAKEDLPRLFAWCGTEDFLYEGNQKVWALVKKLGYDITCTQSPGDHQWKYWDEQIQNVLRWWLNIDIDLQVLR